MEKKQAKLGPVSALGYIVVLAAGITLVGIGGTDLLLLVVGKTTSAKITSVDTRQTGGRRRRSSQTTIQYRYELGGVKHGGSGPWHGRSIPMQGDRATVRYLPFAPGSSAPEDALVGPGLVLILIGGVLIAADVTYFMKRRRRETTPPPTAPPKQRQRRKTA